jgi:hypothetical protein
LESEKGRTYYVELGIDIKIYLGGVGCEDLD